MCERVKLWKVGFGCVFRSWLLVFGFVCVCLSVVAVAIGVVVLAGLFAVSPIARKSGRLLELWADWLRWRRWWW